jgi:hypothetical protein
MDYKDSVDKIAAHLERANFGAYVELIARPWRFFWFNFLAGLFRGFGMAVGMTVIFAVVAYFLLGILRHFIEIPVLGNFIADLIDFVNSSTNHRIKY